jgi:peptidoglycan/LPS O-acetylase OafA/YrhL
VHLVPAARHGSGSALAAAERTHGPGPAGYIAPLTALRGIAALLVVLFHAPMFGLAPYIVKISFLPVKGYIWVDFFFMLSGFIISHVHGASFAKALRRTDVADYLIARVARIFPLHLAVLLALALVVLAGPYIFDEAYPAMSIAVIPEDRSLYSFFANLALVQSWWFGADPSWNVPAWSISCEAAVYLAFPLLAFALANGGKGLAWLLALVCALVLAATWWTTVPHSIDSSRWYLVRCAGEFSIGACIYLLYAAGRVPRLLEGDLAGWIVVAALVVGLQLGLADIALLPLLALLVIVGAVNEGHLAATLGTRVPQFFGRISYAVYLVHYPALIVLALTAERIWGRGILIQQSPGVRALLFLVVLPLILVLATVAYRGCELPCRTRLVRWWGARQRRRAMPQRRAVGTTRGVGPGLNR